jgi:hypothetical protein
MLWDPFITFLLPSYVKAQARTLASLTSPLARIVFRGYDPRKTLKDDWFLSSGVDH